MNYWIFPSNLDEFNSIEYFKQDKQVEWRQVKQSQSAEIDDIVFMYITKNDGKYSQTLAVQAKIVDINKTEYPIVLERVEFFQTPIPLKVLQAIGIVKHNKDNIQSPRSITKEQADKIFEFISTSNSIDKEQEMPNNNMQNKTAKIHRLIKSFMDRRAQARLTIPLTRLWRFWVLKRRTKAGQN